MSNQKLKARGKRNSRQMAARPIDLSRFKQDPEKYFPPEELVDAGVDSNANLERKRWARIGIPFVKRGRRVLYRGQDVIESVESGRVETQDRAA